MGAISKEIQARIDKYTKQLENKSLTADEKEFVQEELDDAKKELEELNKAKETPKKEVKKKVDKKESNRNYLSFEADVLEEFEKIADISTGDADGIIMAHEDFLKKLNTDGVSVEVAAKKLKEKAFKSHEKTETKKEEKSEHGKKFSSLKVGEDITDEDGNVIKHTDSDTYMLHYHQGKNTVVAFNKKGGKWFADCCEKKGIEFSAEDIDYGISEIIEGLDCHYELIKRKANAQKRKEARAKYEAQPDSTKVEKTIEKAVDSVENKIDEIKKDGKGIAPSKAKSFGVDIAKLVKVIDKGIKEQADAKSLLKNLIKELQKLI